MRKLLYLIAVTTAMICSNNVTAQYCSSNPSCGNAYISTVNFNGTSNNSGAGGYTLYSSPTFTISPLQVCTITISGSIAFAGNYHLNAWIDFDGSGDWNGVNSELIAIPTVSYPLGAFTKTTTFTVPAIAAVGNSRLRVQLRYVGPVYGAPNPCVNSFCGEVEDYPVVIAPLPPLCSSSSNNSSSIYISRTDVNGETTFSGPSTYSSYLPGITLFPHTNYTLSVDITNPTSTAQSVYIYGWLEVNGDLVFSQNANEQIVVTPTPVNIPAFSTQSFSKVFYYSPPYAPQASTLRVTASLASNGVPTPCATSFTGEVEDYSVVMHTDYCTDAGASNSDYITIVTLNGVSNPSGPSLYSDFTNVVIPVFPGQTFPLTIATAGSPTMASVYVDFNQNGYFQDPGEQINLTAIPGGFTGNIPVPAGATVGNTRMRVVTLYTVGGGNALPCYLNGVSGEVEDYTVMIVSPDPPVMSCGSDIIVSQEPGQCYKQVLYSLPLCTANCNGGVVSMVSGIPSGSNFPMGTTPVTYKVVTPGGATSCTFFVTVNLNPLPVFSPAGTQYICQGNSANLSINNGTSYLWSTGATTSGITTSTDGTYIVTVTGSSGCTQAFVQTVVVNPLPTPTITGDTSICAGSSSILNAGPYVSYNWSTGATAQTISVNTAGTFTVTVTDVNGCVGTSPSVSTIINPLPTPTISGTLVFCSGSPTTLNAGSYTGYNWSTGATTQTISVSTAGTFTVTVTDANGCVGTSPSVSTTVNPLPTPTISGTLVFCSGSTTTLDAGSYSGYNWSTGAIAQTISVSTAGTFTVTVTDVNGCVGTSPSVSTTVNPLPTPTISGTLAFCSGSSTTLDAGAYSGYNWSTGATAQTISASTAGTFTVTVTDGNGCVGTSPSVSTTVNPLPTPTITGTTAFCPGSSTILDAGTFSGYNWSTGATTQTISVNTAATFTVTVTDANGCSGSTSKITRIHVLPNAAITAAGPTTFCLGGSVTLNAVAVANRTYQWKKGAAIIPGATLTSYNATTTGSYRVIVTNTLTGCSKTTGKAIVVTVNAPTATITPLGPTTFCAGGSVVLQANAGAGLNYQWKKGNAVIPPATSQNYTATTAGTYKVIVTDANSCSRTSAGILINVPCREEENGFKVQGLRFEVYPNPAHDEITVSIDAKESSDLLLQLTDITGRIVLSEKESSMEGLNTYQLGLNHLSKGVYMLEVKSGSESRKTKVVVE